MWGGSEGGLSKLEENLPLDINITILGFTSSHPYRSNSKYDEKKNKEGQAKRKGIKERCASSTDDGYRERDTEADISPDDKRKTPLTKVSS